MKPTKEWLSKRLYYGKDKGYSHMCVIRDSWDNDYFAEYIKGGEDIDAALKEYFYVGTMFSLIETYNYGMDLEFQLNEHRAHHKELPDKTISSIRSSDQITSKKNTGMVKFGEFGMLPGKMNGYIDKEGNFYPTIVISNGREDTDNFIKILIDIIRRCSNDDAWLSEVLIKLDGGKEYEALHLLEDYLVSRLGFGNFYRYIDMNEYGVTAECSKLPEAPSINQLITLRQLFSINHNSSTNIVEKDAEYLKMLVMKIRGDKNECC